MSDRQLSYRAREIEAWVEDHLIDSNGVVYSFVDRLTGKPLDNAAVDAVDKLPVRTSTTAGLHDEKSTTSGYWTYENCSQATASYLEGVLFRYEQERDISALARARRCFQALRYIYEIGKQLEEGFMPKIYDGRFSEETSSDQVLFATMALDHFHQHATDTEKAEISRMITRMVRFFARRDYKFTYFGAKDMQWPLARVTCELLMAYKHSGDEFFKKEYDRLLAMGVNEYPGEEQIRLKLAGKFKPSKLERDEGGWLLSYPTASAQMDLMELDYLLRNDPNNKWATRWKRSCIQMWNEGANMIADDGRAYSGLIMDFETGELRRFDSRFLENDPDREVQNNFGEPDTDLWANWPFCRYIHSIKSAYFTTLYARAGIQVCPHFPREVRIRPLARRIIQSFDLYDMTYFDEPERFVPQFKYMVNLYSSEAAANWLWGYWQGRAFNVFSEME